MRLWFLFITSWLAKTWPFTILTYFIGPFFQSLPTETESDIKAIFRRSGVESRASWTAPEDVYSVHHLTTEGNMKRYKPQVIARMKNAAEKALAPFLALGGSRNQVLTCMLPPKKACVGPKPTFVGLKMLPKVCHLQA